MAYDRLTIISIAQAISEEIKPCEHLGQLTLEVPKEFLVSLSEELKNNADSSFEMLVDTTAIDWLDKKPHRFEVIFTLYSLKNKEHLRLRVPVDRENPTCPTLTSVWESSNWYERETYDMYGIIFEGHPGLRRFYMPEDYNDPETGEPIYPFRKDFPLMGIPGSLPLPAYPEKYGELK